MSRRRVHFSPLRTPHIQPSQTPTTPITATTSMPSRRTRTPSAERRDVRHPDTRECRPFTLYVNYRRAGKAVTRVRLRSPKAVVVCGCRSVSHVWGVFATQSARAARHEPCGRVVAAEYNLSSFSRVHHRACVASAYDPRRPVWIFVVAAPAPAPAPRPAPTTAPTRTPTRAGASRRRSGAGMRQRDGHTNYRGHRRPHERALRRRGRVYRRAYRHAPVVTLCNIM